MPVYSHSRLNTFENCGLNYKFRYIDKIRTGWQSIEAFMGTCVHEVLEELYKNLPAAQSEGPEPLVARFEEIWDSRFTSDVHVIRPDLNPEYYRHAGGRCIRNYWERNFPFVIDPEKIIGLEMRVNLTLDPAEKYKMMGFVDRAQHAEPGVIEIHDYKSSANLPRQSALRFDRQLSLYEIALRQRFPQTQKVRQIWHYVAHGKEFIEERTHRDLDRVKRNCITMIQTIEKATVYPAKKGPLCAWCEHQVRCPEWTDSKPVASPAFPRGIPRELMAPSSTSGFTTKKSAPSSRQEPPTKQASSSGKNYPMASAPRTESPARQSGENSRERHQAPTMPSSHAGSKKAGRKPSQLRLF